MGVFSAVTSMVSLACPTVRIRSTFGLAFTCTRMSFASAFLNPFASASTWYVPGFKLVALYTPALFVFQTVTTAVSTLVTVTVAPGTTAPLESLTIPLMVPNKPCALRLREHTVRNSVTPATRTKSNQALTKCLSIFSPPVYFPPYKFVTTGMLPFHFHEAQRSRRHLDPMRVCRRSELILVRCVEKCE